MICLFVLTGGYALVAQVYFVRELLVQFGGSEICIGVVFSGWFLGICAGALIGAYGARRKPVVLLFLSALALYALLPLGIVPLMRLLRYSIDIPAGGVASLPVMAGGTLFTVVPFGLAVGALFPLACQAAACITGSDSAAISTVYVWESVGSLAAGAAVSFVLIRRFEPLTVLAWGAAALMICAAVLQKMRVRASPSPLYLQCLYVLALLGLLGGLAGGMPQAADRYLNLLRWKSFATGQRRVSSRNSPYQHLTLAEAGGQYSVYANGGFLLSYPNDVESAQRANLMLLEHPEPRSVLMLGGAYSGDLKYILQHNVRRVDCVELDPALQELMQPVLLPQDRAALRDPRVRLYHDDGRRFLQRRTQAYDLVIVNAPEPSTALANRYYTTGFYRAACRALAPSGVLVATLADTADYVGDEEAVYARSMYQSLVRVFPEVLAVPGYPNRFFAGKKAGLVTADIGELRERWRARRIASGAFDPVVLAWLLPAERIDFLRGLLQKGPEAPCNTDDRPVTYLYNLAVRERMHGGDGLLATLSVRGGTLAGWMLAGLCAIGLSVLLRTRRRTRAAGCWALMTTGCAAMALEIVLIFMFQNRYGCIYEQLGLFVAFFMLGLVAGGAWMSISLRSGYNAARLRQLLALIELLVCLYLCLLIAVVCLLQSGGEGRLDMLWQHGGRPVLFGMMLLIGLLAGMEFPLVNELLGSAGWDARRAAGWSDAMDHLGACLGAGVSGVLLVPVLGIVGSCCWLLGMKGASLLLVAVTMRGTR